MPVLELGVAFMKSKAMFAAIKLGVFETLARTPGLTVDELGRACGLFLAENRPLYDFFDLLTGMRLLQRDGSIPDTGV